MDLKAQLEKITDLLREAKDIAATVTEKEAKLRKSYNELKTTTNKATTELEVRLWSTLTRAHVSLIGGQAFWAWFKCIRNSGIYIVVIYYLYLL